MHECPGHIRLNEKDGNTEHIQTAAEHCRQTAEYAGGALSCIGLGTAAFLAGLVHDCGKFTRTYEDYLRKAIHGIPVQKGSVNHTFAGVRYLLQHFHSKNISTSDISCELIAYAAGAHHGLFDLASKTKQDGFTHRLTASIEAAEAIKNFLEQCASREELDCLFQKSASELENCFAQLQPLAQGKESELCFYLGLLARMLLSSVIDGDRRDTAEFMLPKKQHRLHPDRAQCYRSALTALEQKLQAFPADTPIQQARRNISDACHHMAQKPGGLYALNVPTGAGKTLASLRYALAHSITHDKQRIFFVMPLLSIIEQNSTAIQRAIGDSSLILEHHSNMVREAGCSEDLSLRELLMENWDAPITVTTLVQFLETLFSGKTSAIRRFRSLCSSVIVIDEVQTVPTNMLTLFNLAVNFLVKVCGATVVLCSATQPSLEKADHPLFCTPQPIVPHDDALWQTFSRTRIIDAGEMQLSELPAFIQQQLLQTNSLLVICNKKATATKLYAMVKELQIAKCYHLSASMCMAHRRDTMESMKNDLKDPEEKIICISTQVMEAGVDVSFGCVIRLTAGMDSVVQAAGRCNRNGEAECEAPVYLIRCLDEQLTYLREIQSAQNATEELLAEYRQHPEQFSDDLSSDEAIAYYYQRLYLGMPDGHQNFFVPTAQESLFAWLSENERRRTDSSCQFFMQQAFDTAGKHFRVFDTDTVDVLVPYGAGEEIIAALGSEKAAHDMGYLLDLTRQAKPYTVALFSYQQKALEEKGAMYTVCDGTFYVLQPEYYHDQVGLTMEGTSCDILIL